MSTGTRHGHPLSLAAALALAWAAAPACGGSGDTDPDDDAADDEAPSPDPCGFPEPAAATVDVASTIDIWHDTATTRIAGTVRDGPDPPVHRVVLERGACRYLEVAYGSCDPPCDAGAICTFEDECAPYPTGISGGTLTVTGLGDPLAITEEDWSPGTYVGPYDLPAVAWSAGDAVGATLAGGDFAAASMGAVGVAPMDTAMLDGGLLLTDGADNVITWAPGPDPEACVQVVINGFNTAHGAPLSDILWCEGTDTGSLVVPRELVERFPHGSTPEVTSGYDWPHSELTRYSRSTAATATGPAELVVRSTTYVLLEHPE